MIVYHGTTQKIVKPDIKHSKTYLDFGSGFYTTSFQKQAERWALRKAMRISKPAIVNVYEVANYSAYKVKRFIDIDREWLEFVVNCRNGGGFYKNYDAIIGSVANDDVFKCVSMYMDGVWDADRTLKELRYYRRNDQIAFISQDIIENVLKYEDSYEVKP